MAMMALATADARQKDQFDRETRIRDDEVERADAVDDAVDAVLEDRRKRDEEVGEFPRKWGNIAKRKKKAWQSQSTGR